ncbi:MAG: hypothetical protein M3Y22_05820 [Pseudomonadota bacterium]|nr:hypothetical protein [Pseudomonadota bacterium]
MGVFELCESRALGPLLNWIAGDNERSLADLVADLLPAPTDDDGDVVMEAPVWVRTAWTSRGPMRSAAYLWAMRHYEWHENEPGWQKDELMALEDFARKHAIDIRRGLTEPAAPSQIADALSTLTEVLNQELGERSAEFIIEIVEAAGLPVYLLNALFQRVAMTEAGRIKPASFTRLLEAMQPRLKQAWRATGDARAFVQQLDPALAYLREHTGDEGTDAPPVARRLG